MKFNYPASPTGPIQRAACCQLYLLTSLKPYTLHYQGIKSVAVQNTTQGQI